MAKKKRRVKRPRLSETQLVRPNQVREQVLPVEEVTVPEAVDNGDGPDFRREYHYVIKDLERIGILAAAMLGGLIALSFIL
jgi:hypothetical protein